MNQLRLVCHIKVFCINYSNCNRNEEPYSRKQLYLLLWPKFCYNHEHLSIKNLDGLIKEVQGIVILRECSSCLKQKIEFSFYISKAHTSCQVEHCYSGRGSHHQIHIVYSLGSYNVNVAYQSISFGKRNIRKLANILYCLNYSTKVYDKMLLV